MTWDPQILQLVVLMITAVVVMWQAWETRKSAVWGRVTFSDLTGKQRWKRFGRVWTGGTSEIDVSVIHRKGFNSAGEWTEGFQDDDQHYEPQSWK